MRPTVKKTSNPVAAAVVRAADWQSKSMLWSMPKLTAGQAHDGCSAVDMFEIIQAGNLLLSDRAYDSDALRDDLQDRGAWDVFAHAKQGQYSRLQRPPFTNSETPTNASSKNSNTSLLSQPDTTNATTISSLSSNSLQFVCGCDLMSRPPNTRSSEARLRASPPRKRLRHQHRPPGGRRSSSAVPPAECACR